MTVYFVKYIKNIHLKNHDNRSRDLVVIMDGQTLRQNAEHDQKLNPPFTCSITVYQILVWSLKMLTSHSEM